MRNVQCFGWLQYGWATVSVFIIRPKLSFKTTVTSKLNNLISLITVLAPRYKSEQTNKYKEKFDGFVLIGYDDYPGSLSVVGWAS